MGIREPSRKLAKKLRTRQKKESTKEGSSTSHSKLERQDHVSRSHGRPSADQRCTEDCRHRQRTIPLNVDIACLQKTRLADNGTIREANCSFFWQGKPVDEPRQHGVGFAVKNTLVAFIEPPSAGTERIISLRLSTHSGSVNIVSVYAPTLCSTPEDKDQFYQALDETISRIPSTEGLYLLGDFNARVGADHMAWPACIGSFGRGNMNDNGQRLRALLLPRPMCNKHILQVQGDAPSILEAPTLQTLASARSRHYQAYGPS